MNSDIVGALHEGSVASLIMLDLSTAVHVTDHLILLKRLEFTFTWAKSCLTERKWHHQI